MRDELAVLPLAAVGSLSLPSPEGLSDEEIARKLWEVIYGLSLCGVFLHNTDHLSDRELYTYFWSDALREPGVPRSENPAYSCRLDPLGSCRAEDSRPEIRVTLGICFTSSV